MVTVELAHHKFRHLKDQNQIGSRENAAIRETTLNLRMGNTMP
jgi:hypothetical protein